MVLTNSQRMSLFPDAVEVLSNSIGEIVLKTIKNDALYGIKSCILRDAKHAVFAEVVQGGGYKMELVSLLDGSTVCDGYLDSCVLSGIVCSNDNTTIALACYSHHYFDKSNPVGRLVLLDAKSFELKKNIVIETGDKRADFITCDFHPKNRHLMFVVVRPHGSESDKDSRVGLLDTRTTQFVWSCQGRGVTTIEEKIILPHSGELVLYRNTTPDFLIAANAETGKETARFRLDRGIDKIELSHDSRTVAMNFYDRGNVVMDFFSKPNEILILKCADLSRVAIVGPFFGIESFISDESRVVVWSRENNRLVAGIGPIVVSMATMENSITVYPKNSRITNTRQVSRFPDGSGRMLGRIDDDKIVVFHPRGARNYEMNKIIVAAAAGMKRKLVIPEEVWKLIIDKFYYR